MSKIINGMNKIKKTTNSIIINNVAGSMFVSENVRNLIYKSAGIKIGRSRIRPNLFFEGNDIQKIKIGDGVFINNNCVISANANIIIEDNCTLAMEVSLCTSTHILGTESQRAGKAIGKDINIKKGTWIGTRTTIISGVTIGEGCVIASGAVVNKDCEPNGLYAGVPARRIKDLD